MREQRAQEAMVIHSRRAWRLALAAGLVGLMLSVVWSSVTVTGADAQLRSPAGSDPRATFVNSNVVTCSGAGFPLTIQMGSPSNTNASDAFVSGTVATNAGTVQPGVGEEVNITIVGPNVVIDAVIVKGGQAHNVYSNAAFLPPTLVAPQHYISPFNGGGNVPTISHWFVCYHLTTPPSTGTLTVEKAVIAPDGIPVSPLPTSYSAVVNCDDGIPAHENVTVTFNLGGGRAATLPQLTGLADGTTCTVVEQNSGSFPAGAVVTYVPADADDPGVTIAGGVGVVIGIVNNFSGVAVQRATIELTKTVVAVPDVEVPATFTAHVDCDDGTSTDVTLPGTGGPGTPVVTARAPALCLIEELADFRPARLGRHLLGRRGSPERDSTARRTHRRQRNRRNHDHQRSHRRHDDNLDHHDHDRRAHDHDRGRKHQQHDGRVGWRRRRGGCRQGVGPRYRFRRPALHRTERRGRARRRGRKSRRWSHAPWRSATTQGAAVGLSATGVTSGSHRS